MNFQDNHSGWHHKPMNDLVKYPSNNRWIYTAECESVGLRIDREALIECFRNSKTPFGFKRHPDQSAPPVSHDEAIGASYILGESETPIDEWEKNNWQICDLQGFEPKAWNEIDWVMVASDYVKILKLGELYKETQGKEGVQERHATLLFPRVWPVAFKMNGWKRYLIKKHANRKPTLLETLHWFCAKLFTIYLGKSNSSKRILGFQLKMLKKKNILDKTLSLLYNRKYNLKEIAAKEYHENHPILERL